MAKYHLFSQAALTLSLTMLLDLSAWAQMPFNAGSPGGVPADPRQARPISLELLAPNTYWVRNVGFGAFIVGDTGVIAVDTGGSPAAGQQILGAIAKVTPKPVNVLILTHGDHDHIGGITAFPTGIQIIAHENTSKMMEAPPQTGAERASKGGPATAAPSTARIPNHPVGNREELTVDAVRLQLLHWAPAHTSGDLVVYLPGEQLVFAGDIVVKDQHDLPLIHAEKGGTTRGWIESVQGMLALPATRYVIGHEGVVGKEYLLQQMQATLAERKKVKELYDEGMSLQEVETAVGEPLPYSGQGPHFPPLSEVIFGELKAGTY